jgi:hypothetical protein
MHQVVTEPDSPDQLDCLGTAGQHGLGAEVDRDTLELAAGQLAAEPGR